MKSELAEEIFALIEARLQARPTPMEFEMAYQARVATDRIRFAIRHTEQFGPQTEPMREAGLQLLDALERLESTDRHFQARSRGSLPCEMRKLGNDCRLGREKLRSNDPASGGDGMQQHTVQRAD